MFDTETVCKGGPGPYLDAMAGCALGRKIVVAQQSLELIDGGVDGLSVARGHMGAPIRAANGGCKQTFGRDLTLRIK